jgi:hypothetical protein
VLSQSRAFLATGDVFDYAGTCLWSRLRNSCHSQGLTSCIHNRLYLRAGMRGIDNGSPRNVKSLGLIPNISVISRRLYSVTGHSKSKPIKPITGNNIRTDAYYVMNIIQMNTFSVY